MARLIFISPYLKGGQGKASLSRRTRYIATREGVELLKSERGDHPATDKQRTFILRLLESFPQMMELGEYEDYAAAQTMDNAAELIDRATEQFVAVSDQRENYLDYVSRRPGVQKTGDHGLWDRNGKVQNLSKAVEEVANHEGNVWTPVLSLRREDAERLGFTSAENWRALVNACSKELADGYKISPENLRWYAALHEKEKHVHIHLIVFSKNPKEGYLTKQGIRDIKSAFATHIFEQDLLQVYERKTEFRNELQRSAENRMAELIFTMESGTIQNKKLDHLVTELAERLKHTKGRKVYGYLPPQVKRIVDEIVDELSRDERVAAAYSLWQEMQAEVYRTYSETPPEHLPLSRQKEFKAVRNMVIRETLKLSEPATAIEETETEVKTESEEREAPDPEEAKVQDQEEAEAPDPEKVEVQNQEETAASDMEDETEQEPVRPYGSHQAESKTEQERLTPTGAAIIRMLHHMGRIFRDNATADATHKGIQIDRKRRRQLQEKRIAMGHKLDDHEEQGQTMK